MTFFQAVAYFFREAGVNLVRSLRVSLLAIFTIAVSLYVGGLFLLLSSNLSERVDEWRREARVIVYLDPDAPGDEVDRLRALAEEPAWTTEVRLVSPEEAQARFRELFPQLSDLVGGSGETPLPASFEIGYETESASPQELEAWTGALRESPAADLVDDDRDWLAQLDTVVRLVRTVGFALGAVLLTAAVFTTASVIRLSAYIHREEISIMRLVGATEFYIRGPFYTEGFLQGLVGAALAVLALFGTHQLILGEGDTLVGSLLTLRFLAPSRIAAILALGAAAGLTGALVSLRRELPKAATPEEDTYDE